MSAFQGQHAISNFLLKRDMICLKCLTRTTNLLQSDHEHEKKAASESASFFAEGLKATAGHAKEVKRSERGKSLQTYLKANKPAISIELVVSGISATLKDIIARCHLSSLGYRSSKGVLQVSSKPGSFAIAVLLQKVASAMGLSDKKPISDGEDMGPAGHMQGRFAFVAAACT